MNSTQTANRANVMRQPTLNWVLVVNYNTSSRCIDHFSEFAGAKDLGVVVVENGSTPQESDLLTEFVRRHEIFRIDCHSGNLDSERLAESLASGIRQVCIVSDLNMGYAGGNNIVLKKFREILGTAVNFLVLNPDVEIRTADAALLLEHKSWITGPRIFEDYIGGYRPLADDVDFSTGFRVSSDSENRRPYVGTVLSGCCLKLSGSALDKFGYFPEENFLYDEETVFFERVFRIGGNPTYFPEVTVRHIGSVSINKKSYQYFYYNFRNRLQYYKNIARPLYGARYRFYLKYANWFFSVFKSNLKRANWQGLNGLLVGVVHGLRGKTGFYNPALKKK